MKKVTVRYCPGSVERVQTELEKIFRIFSGNGISHLEIELILDTFATKETGKIIFILRKMPVLNKMDDNIVYTFVFRIRPDRRILPHIVFIRNLLRRVDFVNYGSSDEVIKETAAAFRKKNIPCALYVGTVSSEEIKMLRRKSVALNMPILTKDVFSYDNSFFGQFSEWIYDKEGGQIKLFSDILTKILLDDWGTRCQYKSCLTKFFYIDERSDLYLCTQDQNKICNLFDIETLHDIYGHRTFLMLLEQAVWQREKCRRKCEYYTMCHGGCPIKIHTDGNFCKEESFFSEIVKMRGKICDIIQNEDYRELNPVVRELILSSVASNKLFEMELYS